MNKITSGLDQATPIDAWEGTPTSYDFPDVVAGSDGQSYRCLGTAVVGVDPITDDGTSWTMLGFPKGGIIMWSGSIVNIPEGWTLCDGTKGTPDLRDRFVIGAGNMRAVGGTSDGTIPAHVHTGPSHAHTGPSHTHTGPSHTHSGPSHTHGSGTLTTNSTGAHTHTVGAGRSGGGSTGREGGATTVEDTSSNGAHSHSVSGSTASGGTGNTGASGTGNTGSSGTGNTGASGTGNTGSTGTGSEVIAKYYALAFIMKL